MELKTSENLPPRELMVLNSHGHLDHIGGNWEFEEIYAYEHEWRIRKLTEGIPYGNPAWIGYFSNLTSMPPPPEGYDPKTHSIPGIAKENIQFVHEGDIVDLGDRQFRVIVSRSHTEDSIILYDTNNKILFTGDAFVPGLFYVLDLEELEKDMKMLSSLAVEYHYSSHGDQLIDLNYRALTFDAIKRLNKGKARQSEKDFLGTRVTVYEIDGIEFWYMPEWLMY